MKITTKEINTESGIIPTRPGIQLSNRKAIRSNQRNPSQPGTLT